jgi:hypothetical protein
MRYLFAAMALVFCTADAFGADVATCQRYVAQALKDAASVRALGCDFDVNDPTWSLDRDVHARWCYEHSNDEVNDQLDHSRPFASNYDSPRTKFLSACGICTEYVRATMLQIAEEKKLQCGWSAAEPDRWNSEHKDHYHWCMGLKGMIEEGALVSGAAQALRDEDNARSAELDQCRSCRGYAQKSKAQSDQNFAMHCHLTGEDWSSRESDQFARCMERKADPSWMSDVDGDRRNKLRLCKIEWDKKLSNRARINPSQSRLVPRQVPPSQRVPCNQALSGTPCGASTEIPINTKKGETSQTNSNVMGPGLLDGGGGSSTRGPSAGGTAAGPTAPAWSPRSSR